MADQSEKTEFLKEIKMMKKLGSHQNIVNFLYCCTRSEPLFLVVEYLPKGDLLKYLRTHRHKVGLHYRLEVDLHQASQTNNFRKDNRFSRPNSEDRTTSSSLKISNIGNNRFIYSRSERKNARRIGASLPKRDSIGKRVGGSTILL